MSEITDIRKGPRGSRRRRIYLDGDEWLTLPAEVVKDVGLRVGSSLDVTEVEARVEASLPVRAWERALKLIEFRERGSVELRRRLVDDGYPRPVVAGVMQRAGDLGFLDDERFADALARGLVNGRRLGRRRVRSELSAKGIDDALAEQLVARYCGPEEEAARASAEASRLARRSGSDGRKLAAKLVARGFDPGVAIEAADQALRCDDESSERA